MAREPQRLRQKLDEGAKEMIGDTSWAHVAPCITKIPTKEAWQLSAESCLCRRHVRFSTLPGFVVARRGWLCYPLQECIRL